MCTVVVTLAPGERVPLRLLGIRDELTSRPWRPPARHWPGSPLIGGIDEQAGGTWLAVHPGIPRVACLLNGRGHVRRPRAPPQPGRPLAARRRRRAWHAQPARRRPGRARRLRPVPPDLRHAGLGDRADLDRRRTRRHPAARPAVRDLGPGTHLFTNAGHAYPAEPGDPAGEPKAAHFADKFAAARPSADPALPVAEAWGDWLTLASGDGLDPADPAAIIVRRDLPDGRVYGTTSVTLVALADDAVRYDFQPHPGSPDGWYPVAVG